MGTLAHTAWLWKLCQAGSKPYRPHLPFPSMFAISGETLRLGVSSTQASTSCPFVFCNANISLLSAILPHTPPFMTHWNPSVPDLSLTSLEEHRVTCEEIIEAWRTWVQPLELGIIAGDYHAPPYTYLTPFLWHYAALLPFSEMDTLRLGEVKYVGCR